jgi:hypothetical protein
MLCSSISGSIFRAASGEMLVAHAFQASTCRSHSDCGTADPAPAKAFAKPLRTGGSSSSSSDAAAAAAAAGAAATSVSGTTSASGGATILPSISMWLRIWSSEMTCVP